MENWRYFFGLYASSRDFILLCRSQTFFRELNIIISIYIYPVIPLTRDYFVLTSIVQPHCLWNVSCSAFVLSINQNNLLCSIILCNLGFHHVLWSFEHVNPTQVFWQMTCWLPNSWHCSASSNPSDLCTLCWELYLWSIEEHLCIRHCV